MSDSKINRPTKLLWLLPTPTPGQHWSQVIPSKSVRHLAKQKEQLLESSGITYEIVPLTEPFYLEWHEFYARTMREQNHDVIAAPDWFSQKKDQVSALYLLDFRLQDTGERVGASVVSQNFEGVFTHSFKASKRVDIQGPSNASLGLLIELVFVEFALDQQATRISSGVSRNAFGYFNTIGYLASKLRMGYLPQAAPNRPWDSELPKLNESSPTLWFIPKNDQSALTLVAFPTIQILTPEILTYLNRLQIPFKDYSEIIGA